MKTTALAPWFGSNRLLAHRVGELLAGCEWVGVGFAGGMCELAHIKARTLMVNDLHRHVINLAEVVRDQREALQQRLDGLPFHPDTLLRAQERCRAVWRDGEWEAIDSHDALSWAADYFVCSWMARNGLAGTAREFKSGLSSRWNAGGGDSATRFRSAAESLTEWQAVMRRCIFTTLDVFDFLAKVHDQPKHGLYLDPPFPGPGDSYKHTFPEAKQRQLAARLAEFCACRVVVRYYDHPLVRELYPDDQWTWHHPEGGRTQANKAAPEVLLTNRVFTTQPGA